MSEQHKEELSNIIPVILAGGEGRRLRPLSRPTRPKPFLKLGQKQSMLQVTLARFGQAQPPVIIGNINHYELLQQQLKASAAKPQQIFLEPVGRGTAAAVAVAAHYFAGQGNDPLLLVMPSDHRIEQPEILHQAVARAVPVARQGRLVLFGLTPRAPATGFGYIQRGSALLPGVENVASFVEKPDIQTARTFIADKNWLWNSGIFLFSASAYLARLQQFEITLYENSRHAVSRASRRQNAVILNEAAFQACPCLSLDRSILEKDGARAVIPVDMGWRDLGTWPSLLASMAERLAVRQ